MLAHNQRISRGSDYTRTLHHGVRVRRHDLMIYVLTTPDRWPDERGVRLDVAEFGVPRVGLIVSKSVGDAVTRHRVARRLRAAGAAALAGIETPATVVVRAHPSSARASVAELTDQLVAAVRRSGLRASVTS